jgi:hypothetical protein
MLTIEGDGETELMIEVPPPRPSSSSYVLPETSQGHFFVDQWDPWHGEGDMTGFRQTPVLCSMSLSHGFKISSLDFRVIEGSFAMVLRSDIAGLLLLLEEERFCDLTPFPRTQLSGS